MLSHCLSLTNKVQTVDFDAVICNGGVINPGKILSSDLGRKNPSKQRWGRTIQVQCFPLQSVLSQHAGMILTQNNCHLKNSFKIHF